MRHYLLLLAIAIMLPFGNPSFGQNLPGTAAADEPVAAQPGTGAGVSTDTAGSEAQGNVRPNPEGATGTTQGGGVTPTAREIIPEAAAGGETAIPPEQNDTAAAGTQAGNAGQPGEVTPAVIQELRQMAIEAEKKAAQPTPVKTEEAIAAERKAVESHREAVFARIAERQQ